MGWEAKVARCAHDWEDTSNESVKRCKQCKVLAHVKFLAHFRQAETKTLPPGAA